MTTASVGVVRVMADLHFRERAGFPDDAQGVNSWLSAQLDAFRQLCLAEPRPPVLVLAGDVVDKRGPLSAAVSWTVSRALNFAAKNFERVVVLAGNHDCPKRSGGWPSSLDPHFELLDEFPALSFVREAPGLFPLSKAPAELWLLVLPWTPDPAAMLAEVGEVARKAAKPLLVVGHCLVQGAETSSGFKATGAEVCATDFAGLCGAQAVLLGDVHRRQEVKKARGGAGPVFYIGSPWQNDFGEMNDPQKGAIDVFFGARLAPSAAAQRTWTRIGGFGFGEKLGALWLVPSPAPPHVIVNVGADEFAQGAFKHARDLAATGSVVRVELAPGAPFDVRDAAAEGLFAVQTREVAARPRTLAVEPGGGPLEYLDLWMLEREKAGDPDGFDFLGLAIQEVAERVQSSEVQPRPAATLEILEVIAENFLGSKSLGPVHLSGVGLVLVDGRNFDDPTVTSNGAGKSSIAEAVVYGLTGRTLRGVRVADLLWRHAESGATLEVALACCVAGGRELRIARRRIANGPTSMTVFLDGADVTLPTEDQNQRFIDELTGWTFEALRRRLVFGQGAAESFAGMTDGQRKETLEHIAGGWRFDPYWQAAKAFRDEIRASLADNEKELAGVAGAKDEATRTWKRAEQTSVELKASAKSKKSGLRAQIANVEAEVARLAQSKTDREAALDANLIEAALEASDAATAERDRLKSALAGAKAKNAAAKLAADKADQTFSTAANAPACPVCGREWTTGHRIRSVAPLEKERDENRDALLQSSKDAMSLKEQLTAAEQVAQVRERDAGAALVEKAKVDALEASIEDAQEKLDAAKAQLGELESGEVAKRAKADLEAASARWSELDAAQAELDGSIADDKALLPSVEELVRLLGPQGLRVYAFEDLAPAINVETALALDVLADGRLGAELSTETTESGAAKLALRVWSVDGATTYAGLSGGQRRKVDLALLWAVHAAAPGALNLLIADEAFDSLDGEACSRAAAMLRERSSRMGAAGSLLVMTHRQELRGEFENVWTVERRGGDSALV